MVEEIIFGNILRIYGTLDNHFPPHGSSVDHFNQVHEILLGFEAANELGVIWRAIIDLHVLSVEEEDSGGDVAYVEVSRVNGSFINKIGRAHV